MRRAARVQHGRGVRQCLDQLPGAAGVVEVHVGQEHVIHLLAGDPELVERAEQARRRGRRPGVHECRATAVHDEVARGEARTQVQRVDQVDALADRDGQGRSGGHGGHCGHRIVRGLDGFSRLDCGLDDPKTRRPGAPGLLSQVA